VWTPSLTSDVRGLSLDGDSLRLDGQGRTLKSEFRLQRDVMRLPMRQTSPLMLLYAFVSLSDEPLLPIFDCLW
jgi:hypothetical protein